MFQAPGSLKVCSGKQVRLWAAAAAAAADSAGVPGTSLLRISARVSAPLTPSVPWSQSPPQSFPLGSKSRLSPALDNTWSKPVSPRFIRSSVEMWDVLSHKGVIAKCNAFPFLCPPSETPHSDKPFLGAARKTILRTFQEKPSVLGTLTNRCVCRSSEAPPPPW